jgi:hypothetical protein
MRFRVNATSVSGGHYLTALPAPQIKDPVFTGSSPLQKAHKR